MTRALVPLLPAAVALLLGGCVGPATELSLSSPAAAAHSTKADGASMPKRSALRVHVTAVGDRRLDAESIGHTGAKGFVAQGVPDLIHRTLRAQLGERWTLVDAPDQADLLLSPQLHKCYLSTVDITKAAVVVMEVRYARPNHADRTLMHRGRETGMNWFGSDSEMAGALQSALSDCLSKVIEEVAALEKETPPRA